LACIGRTIARYVPFIPFNSAYICIVVQIKIYYDFQFLKQHPYATTAAPERIHVNKKTGYTYLSLN